VTKRKELEAALARAEAAREHLEAALAQAEAALFDTVTDAARIDADRAEASAKVDKARARCRQLRAALAESGHAEFITRSREEIDASVKRPGESSDPDSAAGTRPDQGGVNARRREGDGARNGFRLQKKFQRFNTTLATTPHVRETIGLLSLVSAYLQYYYFDVQLQIISLPSVTTVLLQ
jgi:hypothetical protein